MKIITTSADLNPGSTAKIKKAIKTESKKPSTNDIVNIRKLIGFLGFSDADSNRNSSERIGADTAIIDNDKILSASSWKISQKPNSEVLLLT